MTYPHEDLPMMPEGVKDTITREVALHSRAAGLTDLETLGVLNNSMVSRAMEEGWRTHLPADQEHGLRERLSGGVSLRARPVALEPPPDDEEALLLTFEVRGEASLRMAYLLMANLRGRACHVMTTFPPLTEPIVTGDGGEGGRSNGQA